MTIITFQKALKAYKELKLGSFVKKGVNKSETNFKSAISILQVHDIGVNDEPTNEIESRSSNFPKTARTGRRLKSEPSSLGML